MNDAHAGRKPGPGDPRLANKVFGIGLARTGTTSLHHAMGVLGLRSAPDSIPLLDGIDDEFLAGHDAFFDNPIPFRYRELDEVCPDSVYIVTHRPLDTWLASMEWLFGPGLDRLDPATRATGDRVHRQLYGTDVFDREILTEIHRRHQHEVREWVAGRRHIWLDTDDGLTWEPICELLDRAVPPTPFPRSNQGQPAGKRFSLRRRR